MHAMNQVFAIWAFAQHPVPTVTPLATESARILNRILSTAAGVALVTYALPILFVAPVESV